MYNNFNSFCSELTSAQEHWSFSLPSNKAMEELFNEYNSSRFFERKDPLDDLIAKQKMEKLRKKQGEVRNE